MLISLFLYTKDKNCAQLITSKILNLLNISDIVNIESEPYWKYSDMFKVEIKTNMKNYPNENILKKVADKWEVYSDKILTSDTITDNKIYISDVAMINIVMRI